MPQRKKKTERKRHPDAFKQVGLAKPPETKMVRLEDINVDGHYQRIPRMHKVEMYAANFDPIMCNVLILNKRVDGKLYVMDGNHRRLVLQKVGYTEWKAYVTEGLDSRQEAAKYEGLNSDRSNANCVEKFKARIWYKEPVAVTICETCKLAGFEIVLDKVSHRNGREIHAVAALDWIYGRSNQPGLMQVLKVIAECWHEDEYRCTDSICLKGMHFVLNYKTWRNRIDLGHLIKRLQEATPTKLIRTARGFTDRGVIGDVVSLFGDAVIVENNRRLKKHSKLWLPPRGASE